MKKKEMLINVLQPEECRIAIVEDGILEELYIERASQENYVGNIYKGRIVNIEPSIQAAFVDFGIGRNGFLHVSDVDPAYYKHLLTKEQWEEYERALLQEQEEPSGPSRRGGRRSRGGEREGRESTERPSAASATTSRRLAASPSMPPQPPVPASETACEEEDEGFAAGILEEEPPASAAAGPASGYTGATAPSPTAAQEDDAWTEEEFAAGIDDVGPATIGSAAAPAEPTAVTPATAEPAAGTAEGPAVASTRADDEEEFAAGIVDTDLSPAASAGSERPAEAVEQAAQSSVAAEQSVPPAATVESGGSAAAVAGPTESTTAESTSATAGGASDPPPADPPRPRRRRTSRSSSAAQASPATPPEGSAAPGEESAKPRTRRSRRKNAAASQETAEQEASGPPPAAEDKPRYMEGAEHRTVPPDDEDIQPFYEGIEGFDPDAPNDRFIAEPQAVGEAAVEGHRLPAEPESPEEAEEEARELVQQQVSLSGGAGMAEESRRGRVGRGRGRPAERGAARGSNGGAATRHSRDRGLPKPKIEQIFKRGQEVIVQVIKEAVGTKGPTLSTYISIAGRYLVLMPSLNRVGVSRKIEDPEARRRLRNLMNSLHPPKGVGFIVRTAAVDRDLAELRSDLIYLLRLWQVVVRRIKRVPAPVEIYRESDMITRTIRDIFTSDIDTIWVDEPNAFAHASEFLQIVMPKFANRIRYYDSTEPLFHRYGLEEEIAKIYQKRIDLPQGGSIVIEQTEALVAIDVNSGNFRAENNNAEETAFQMNLQAAKEIARQLRLRDLGGVIVNDFIDMRSEVHRRKVEEALREALKRDRARTKILRISQFGIIEMTRQRIRPSIKRSLFADCPYCNGNGYVKTTETAAIEAMRLLQLAAHRAPTVATAQLTVHLDVAHYLLNKRRREIAALEDRAKIVIQVTGQPHVSPDTLVIRCFDHNGNEVPLHTRPPRLSGGRMPNGSGRTRERRLPAAMEQPRDSLPPPAAD